MYQHWLCDKCDVSSGETLQHMHPHIPLWLTLNWSFLGSFLLLKEHKCISKPPTELVAVPATSWQLLSLTETQTKNTSRTHFQRQIRKMSANFCFDMTVLSPLFFSSSLNFSSLLTTTKKQQNFQTDFRKKKKVLYRSCYMFHKKHWFSQENKIEQYDYFYIPNF